MTDVRRPLHLAVMIGASTAVYAASLAAVTAFQSSADRALMQRQAPAEDAVTRLRLGHDHLETSIGDTADAYDRAAGGYDALAPKLLDTENSLSDACRTRPDDQRRGASPAGQDHPAADQPDGGRPDRDPNELLELGDVQAEDHREHGRLRRVTVGSPSDLPPTRFEARAMGSPLRLTLGRDPLDADEGAVRWAAVRDEFELAEAAMSRFRDTSEVTALNRTAGSGDRRTAIAPPAGSARRIRSCPSHHGWPVRSADRR